MTKPTRERAWLLAGTLFWVFLGSTGVAAQEEAEPTGARALLEDIRTRQAVLDRREADLIDRERRVEELEALVSQRMDEIETLAGTLEQRIQAWEEGAGDSIRKLSKIYAAMPPKRAAALLEGLELSLATQIVSKMKDKQSAAVLGLLSGERALQLSRQVAHPLMMDPASIDAGAEAAGVR